MSTMTPVSATDPLMVAWNTYKQTDEYANAKRWAIKLEHVEGSLWAMFMAGYQCATVRAAALHEQVDPASDSERLNRLPGAGAMGAVVEYRDKIRQTVAP